MCLTTGSLRHQILVWNEPHFLMVVHGLHLHGHHHGVLRGPGAKITCALLLHQVNSTEGEASLSWYHILAILLLDLLLHLFKVDELAYLIVRIIIQRAPSMLKRLLTICFP